MSKADDPWGGIGANTEPTQPVEAVETAETEVEAEAEAPKRGRPVVKYEEMYQNRQLNAVSEKLKRLARGTTRDKGKVVSFKTTHKLHKHLREECARHGITTGEVVLLGLNALLENRKKPGQGD